VSKISSQETDVNRYLEKQEVYDQIQDIKDLIAVIEILKLNELEKNLEVFDGKTVFQLV